MPHGWKGRMHHSVTAWSKTRLLVRPPGSDRWAHWHSSFSILWAAEQHQPTAQHLFKLRDQAPTGQDTRMSPKKRVLQTRRKWPRELDGGNPAPFKSLPEKSQASRKMQLHHDIGPFPIWCSFCFQCYYVECNWKKPLSARAEWRMPDCWRAQHGGSPRAPAKCYAGLQGVSDEVEEVLPKRCVDAFHFLRCAESLLFPIWELCIA